MAQSGSDRRRITGPEESRAPVFDDEDSVPWRIGEPRRGRGAKDIRPIFLKAGLISQANGSAYIETQRTKIACAVYGPRQSKSSAYSENGKLNVDVKFAPFSCPVRRAPLRDAEDRSVSVLMHQALVSAVRLELFPKAVIDIFVVVIECDGLDSCIASGTVACSTALANAGIEMLGLVMSCAAISVGDDIWLDPTGEEAENAVGSVILACMPALSTVTSVRQVGSMPPATAMQAMDICQERCTDIHQVVAQALLASTKNSE
ncbi:ribosomal protein S5 domain 2-type protein [Vararia minispora EC-137]|uniref:Ribosomal protein S5 domain 2-type protein n=1 Tax=Vararia minispora EC-137 TaxID=1314806 RepID=A0ACB8QTE0_9AGAM|nr:ribosomal protein S5 domain 2-type protein [Vararia minispora EC-137]